MAKYNDCISKKLFTYILKNKMTSLVIRPNDHETASKKYRALKRYLKIHSDLGKHFDVTTKNGFIIIYMIDKGSYIEI